MQAFDEWLKQEPHRSAKPKPKAVEHGEQAALFQWAQMNEQREPMLELLYAIPNGGKRDKRTAALLRAEGVKAGVPDTCLPVARQGFHGLYIEMKAVYGNGKRGTTSLEQRWWLRHLAEQGYMVAVCHTWIEAARVLAAYLDNDALFDELGG